MGHRMTSWRYPKFSPNSLCLKAKDWIYVHNTVWEASFYLPSLHAREYPWCCCRHLSTGIISLASSKVEILKINLCQGQHRNHWLPHTLMPDIYLHFHNTDLSNMNHRKTERWKVIRKKVFEKYHIVHLTWYNLWKRGFGILLGLNRSSEVSPSSWTKFIESIRDSTADNWSAKAAIIHRGRLNILADGCISWNNL